MKVSFLARHRSAPGAKALLVLDSYAAHVHHGVLQSADNSNVMILGLPPHSTHITQPLDRTVMSPFKLYDANSVYMSRVNNPRLVISDHKICYAVHKNSYSACRTQSSSAATFPVCMGQGTVCQQHKEWLQAHWDLPGGQEYWAKLLLLLGRHQSNQRLQHQNRLESSSQQLPPRVRRPIAHQQTISSQL